MAVEIIFEALSDIKERKYLLSRGAIIKLWQDQSDELLSQPCCPDCRDILEKDEDGYYYCERLSCFNNEKYIIDKKEEFKRGTHIHL
jgi:hypothetical protein